MASELPEGILKKSEAAMKQLVPEKSSKRYEDAYNKFLAWRKDYNTESFVEDVFLAYFEDAATHYAPSTLWSMYSMLKSKLIANHNIDISRYSRLMAFVKRKNVGYQAKQATVFTPEEIKKFLLDAPDSEFLAVKAVTVFGISGGWRGDELVNTMFGYVTDTGSEIVVRIPESKTYTAKLFPILSPTSIGIIRRYVALRPANSPTDRFFILQRGNKCCGQPIGKNTIAQMPMKIAKFLNLERPDTFTGHSFRRSSTTMAADAGASLEEMKRYYYWKSNTVVERYIRDSLGQKRMLAGTITKALDLDPAEVSPAKIARSSTDMVPINSTANDNMPTNAVALDIGQKNHGENGDMVVAMNDVAAGAIMKIDNEGIVNVDAHNFADDDKENYVGSKNC